MKTLLGAITFSLVPIAFGSLIAVSCGKPPVRLEVNSSRPAAVSDEIDIEIEKASPVEQVPVKMEAPGRAETSVPVNPEPAIELGKIAFLSLNPFQWHSIDDATYEDMIQPAVVFPKENIMTKRMQAWSDKLFTAIVDANPAAKVIPKPQIRIQDNDDDNAYVGVVDVCVDVPIKVEGEPKGSDVFADPNDHLSYANGGLYSLTGEGCDPFKGNLEEKRAAVQWAIRLIKDCKVSITGTSLTLSSACREGSNWLGTSHAGMIVNHQMNHATLLSGLFRSLKTEAEVVAVMAHELGHYVMAHTVADIAKAYNFYYPLDVKKARVKPVPLSSDDPRSMLVRRLKNLLEVQFAPIQAQTFHSLLFTPNVQIRLGRLPEKECLDGTGDCLQNCQSFGTNVFNHYDNKLGGMPRTAGNRAAYIRYESDVEACFKGLDAKYFEKGYLRDLKLPTFLDLKLPVASQGEDLLEYISQLSSLLDTATSGLMEERQKLSDEAIVKKLGWYTAEQEADELGVMFLIMLGIDPQAAIKKELFWERVNKASCEQAYKSAFLEPIPLRDFLDIHHDGCFRAYNAFLEIKGYEEVPMNGIVPDIQPGTTWEQALQSLKVENSSK